jgi:5-methylcytosine-specific restriction endonuclease McrA
MSLTVKTCTGCKKIKTLDCYGKKTASKDGLQFRCKECENARSKAYRLEHPDKVKASVTKCHLSDPSKRKLAKRKWNEANPEKRKANNKKYIESNSETYKQRKRKWRESNPEKLRYYANSRRAKKLANGVYEISTKELKRLYESPCLYCGSTESIQADHVIPISKGGVHSIGNLVPACAKCNVSKHNKFLIEWKATLTWAV